MSTRRQLIQGAAGASLLAALGSRPAWAQALDQVRIYYGFPPGSSGDIAARRVAEKLSGSAYSKNAAIVENKPGAGGRIAIETCRTAPADGSALVMTPHSPMTVYPHIYKKLSYDPMADFVPVSICAVMYHGFAVGPQVPATVKTLKDFLAWAKANPGLANYGSPAAGSIPHFLGALLGINSGVELKHVPYRGSMPGITDVVGGTVAAMCTPHGDFLPNHRAGKLRLIAVSGAQRSPFAPDVGTFAEQGFGDLTTEEWFGFYAPAKTPAPVLAAANAAIGAALKDQAVIDSLATVGLIARGSTPEAMAASHKSENERWGPLVKKVGFTAES